MEVKKIFLHFLWRTAFIFLVSLYFTKTKFHPVIHLPKEYEVFDFTKTYDPNRKHQYEYGIGRYNEKRPTMYTGDLYKDLRNIHVGIDIMAPVATPIHAFYDGRIYLFDNNDQDLDYGYTLITEHFIEEQKFYALFGHLSKTSIENKHIGQKFKRGEVIASIGDKNENGGWNPHLHFQLSINKPLVCDLPGVVAEKERKDSLRLFPDPRIILGPIYKD